MDDVLRKILEAFEAGIKINQQLCADLRKSIETMNKETEKRRTKRRSEDKTDGAPVDLKEVVIEHPCGCKVTGNPATSIYCAEHKKNMDAARGPELGGHPHDDNAADTAAKNAEPKAHADGGALQVKDVTIEMIRAVSTEFSDSKNFGMDAWLTLAQEITGQKKVKDIPPTMYGAFYGAMKDRLAKLAAERKDKAALTSPALPPQDGAQKPVVVVTNGITIEQLKEKAKSFMDRNGQPALVALVKAFGATKISEVPHEKYGAFLEAISNA